jgi:ADP-ribosyl-[dinitrogen reductase] hydrolase
MGTSKALDRTRIASSLKCMLVGDALAMPVHWYYSPKKLREEYGEVAGMVAPKSTHAESMIQGMSYKGSIDILHDKAIYYEGNSLKESLTEAQIAARRDDHGNFVGATADERAHYHQSLVAGQNTANACIARLLMRYLGEKNSNQRDCYDPDEFLELFQQYMCTPPNNKDDKTQVAFHNDTYLDVYLRVFFTTASDPKACETAPYRKETHGQLEAWTEF